MDHRSPPAVPLDGLARLFGSLERRSGWAATSTPAGLLLWRRFDPWPLVASGVFAAVATIVALALVTVPGTASLVGRVVSWGVCALALVAGASTLRRPSLSIDLATRHLKGSGEDGDAIEAPWSDVRSIELVRRPRDGGEGSATMRWVVGGTSHHLLEVERAGAPELTRTKALALGLAALFGAPFVERSTAAARASLAAPDQRAGVDTVDPGDPSSAERLREIGAAAEARAVSAVEAGAAFLKVLELL
jgi:hypothetical protein